MADDDHLNVDLDIGSNSLENSLRRTFDLMTVGLERAERIRISMENTAAATRRIGDGVRNNQDRLLSATSEFDRNAIGNAIKQSAADYKRYNDEVRTEIALQKDLALARGAAERVRTQTRLPDGRTVGEARGANNALTDAVTGINTTSDQLAARLALATGKAMERLLGSTADAIEKSYQVAQQRQMSRNAQLSVPGYLDARVTNDRVAAELAVERASQGGSLAERRTRAARVAELEAQAVDTERRERDFARQREAYRAAEIREGLRDQARDANPNTAIQQSRRDSSFTKRYGVDYDTYTRDTEGQSTTQRVAYLKRYEQQVIAGTSAGKTEEDARKAAADVLKKETAQRERFANAAARDAQKADFAQYDPVAALRQQRSDLSFQRRYGVSRQEYETQTAGMGRRDRVAYLNQNDASGRTLTADDRARAGFDQRAAAFNLNGGADQFLMQARVTANYAAFGLLTGAIRGSMQAVVEFDDNLAKFQAITGAANSEMGGFRAGLLEVASTSKFSVNELTQVAIALGQTGLAASEVNKALKPVADLAAASGATLQESVEAITGVLGAYNMEAGRASDVADVFVAALNRTKLTMGQLQLGIQYAANIARDSGVSFTELTASIGAISQAGVKSGSTIGTGMRQLITELAAPTEKLRGVLKELGIDLEQVDLRTQGFSGVLQNLQKAGFGGAEALRAFDLRAAAAFSALVGQADKLGDLQQKFLLTSAATEGAKTANESLSASAQRLTNTVFALADKAFSPLITVLSAAAGGTANLLQNFQALGPTLPLVAAGIGAISTAFVALKSAQLVGGLLGVGGLAALSGLAPLLATGGLVAAGGGLIYFLSQIQTEAGKAEAALDKLKGVENILTSRQQTIGQRSGELEGRIQSLIDRRDRLNSDPVLRQTAVIEAQKAFGDLGLAVDPARTSIDDLIKSLQGLRGELSKDLPVVLGEQLAVVTQKIAELQKLQEARARENQTQIRLVPGVMGAGYQSDPLDATRRLGPTYQTMAEIITDPKLLGDNPIGYGAPLRRDAQDEVTRLRLDQAKARVDGNSSEDTRLGTRIDAIEKTLEKFNAVINLATERQAGEIRKSGLQQALTTAELQREPAYIELKAAKDVLGGRQDQAVLAAGAGQQGYRGAEAMRIAAHVTDDAVREQLAQIKQLTNDFSAHGTTDEDRARLRKAAEDAYREVSTQLEAILRGNTKEVRDRLAAAAPAQKAFLNSQIRSDEAQLGLVQRQASLSRDPAQVAGYQALATQIQGEINAAREQLFKIEQGATPDDVVSKNPELQAKRAEIKEMGATKLTQLAQTYGEIHKRLQDQLLSYRIEGEQDRKGLLQEQIKGLEKVRDDVRSTPEQMRAAVQEINRLLGEVANIGKGINSLQADREALKVPQGMIPPTATYAGGSVKDQIVKQLQASGASEERIRYALASGQIESGYAPDVISGDRRSSAGAAGLFQFMPKTWNNMYGTRDVNTDVSAQIAAFQQFTNRNAGTFQSNMGRAATAEELYLMHQQGSAGAMALLRAGNGSALDALSGVYGSSAVASKAITGNGGRSDMSADEFVQLIMRKFRNAESAVGNPFSTTGDKEVARRRQRADDTTIQETENAKAENDRKAAAAARASTLAQLRKEDKGLTEQYDAQLTLAKRVQDPAKVLDANRDAYKTLGELFSNAKARDENSPDRGSEEDREAARTGTRKRFADLYAQQGLNQAEVAGKAQVKKLNEDLETALAQKKELERPENIGREGNTALLNQLNEQINVLQKRKELESDYEGNQAKIVALEETLRQMKAAGLDTDKDTLVVRERLRDLAEQQRRLEPSRNFAGSQARTQKTYGEAFSGAVDSFEKSRGIRNPLGELVGPVEQAQKEITTALNTVGNAFDNLFVNMANGSMTAGAALKKFATDILGGLMSQLSKSLTNDIFKSLFSSAGGGGSSTGFLASLFGGGAGAGGADVGLNFLTFANGGPIRMAGGGGIPSTSASNDNRDSRLILGMPGEYMLRKSAVDAIGRETLDQVNALGGAMVNRAPKVDATQKFGGASANANVYVVDRDQVPPPSKSEIVHMIGDDIQRGGSIKQLIKRVQAGG